MPLYYGSLEKQNQQDRSEGIYYGNLYGNLLFEDRSQQVPLYAMCKLENQESQWCNSVWVQWPTNQESWWYNFQFETKGLKTWGTSGVSPGVWRPRTWSLDVHRQEKMDIPAPEERLNSSCLCLFVLYGPPNNAYPTLVRRDLPYSVHWFNCQFLPEIPSQTYPKLMLISYLGIP